MKYTIALVFFAIITIGVASCDNESTTNNMSDLPSEVQNTVLNNFKSDVLAVNTETSTFGETEYEVILADGSKITFEGTEWDEVEVPLGQNIPATFVLQPITDYVSVNMPGQTIVKVDKDKKGYEVKTSGGVEIKFDLQGNFVKID